MDHIDLLDRAYERLAKLTTTLTSTDLSTPTPCPDWNVRGLLNHTLGATRMFTLVNAGHKASPDAGDLIGDNATGAVTVTAADNLASWRQPGGLDGQRSYPFGTFPAPAALLVNLTEIVVHGWDLARATDQDATIDNEVASTLGDFWAAVPLDDARAGGAFGPPVAIADAAPSADRLLAYLGRRP